MIRLSAAVITYNEEEHIARCLSSLEKIADEIIVLDSFSTDRTQEICLSFGVHFHQQLFAGHIEQKNDCLKLTTYDHVISLDADECLSDQLIEEVLRVKKNWDADAYRINRLNQYCGQWIRHGAWYPDRKLRLFDKRHARWGGVNPHDKVIVSEGAKTKHLPGDILHYTIASTEEHDAQIEKFSEIRARELFRLGKRPNTYQLMVKPWLKFGLDYFLKLGFLDGKNGFTIAYKSALAYRKRYEKLKALYE